jgi:hypothetical protein
MGRGANIGTLAHTEAQGTRTTGYARKRGRRGARTYLPCISIARQGTRWGPQERKAQSTNRLAPRCGAGLVLGATAEARIDGTHACVR